MPKSYYQTALENREKLNAVSPSFCLAKWLQVSIHLPTGRTHSCYHPPTHKIPLDLLAKDPGVLHNTPQKAVERTMMKAGQKPPGCAYCWKIEALEGNHLSDRHYRSSEDWAWEKFDEIKGLPGDYKILPRYVEVNFNQACQFKCSYCSPQLSSSWMSEIKQFGYYPTSWGHNRMNWFIENDLVPYGPDEANPYVEAFWKWWPSLYPELKVFRMTGGEPLIDENTFRVLEYAWQNPNPALTLSITSNLNPPEKSYDRFINTVSKLLTSGNIKEFSLFVSIDSTGAQAEYIRNGLNFQELNKNIDRWLALPGTYVSLIQTVCNLAVPGFKNYLQWILELRKKHNTDCQRISFDTPFLRSPGFMSLQILDAETKQLVDQAIDWAENHVKENPDSIFSFSETEIAKIKRVAEWLKDQPPADELSRNRADFYFFFTEHDLRRKTDFHKTFPELKRFWEICHQESKKFERTYDPLNKFKAELEKLK